jgi:hypothetical protein
MKSIILILLLLGIILMVKGYAENYKNCPLPKIEYRYIPRNFYEEQITENNLKSLYSDMFNKQDSWSKYPVGDADIINKVDNNTNFINEDDYDNNSEL